MLRDYQTGWCLKTGVLERILDNGGTGDDLLDQMIEDELLRREQASLAEMS